MAIINKNGTYMALPSAIKRGSAVALDTTSVWYDRALMEAYAKGGAVAEAAGVAITAYVGQILTLVNEDNNSATAYIIMDVAGTLQEVGSATLGDNKTIVLNDSTLSLKNWGVQYYKWVEGNTEGEGEHVLVTVDETNPWIAGLEPKVATGADGVLELAWYQPSTLTVEGVSSAVSSIQTTVNNLTNAIGTAEDEAGAKTVYGAINEVKSSNNSLIEQMNEKLGLSGGTLTGDLILADGSKAASETVVDTKIASAVASAGHLKRQIVTVLPPVEEADPDTIYMIKSSYSILEDKYKEYLLVDGAFEQIGDTSVDLTNYIQKVENAVENNLTAFSADGALIDAGIAISDVSNHLADNEKHITANERTSWNEGAALAAENATAIENLVKISQDDANKLAALPAITQIGANLELANGVLSAVAEQYELPAATAGTLGGIKVGTGLAIDSEGLLSVPVVEGNGLSLGDEGLVFGLASESAAGAMSAENYVKLTNLPANAAANVVEGMVLGANEVAVEINENKQLVLPFATADAPGVIVSSAEDNHISVDAVTGKMALNRVSTSKLYVPAGEDFILNGGDSKI